MNSKILLAAMVLTVLTVGYFFGPLSSAKTEKVIEEVVFEQEATAASATSAVGTVQQLDDGTRVEVSGDGMTTKIFHPDGSESTTTKDGFGNSTQSRFYVDNTRVKGVAVFTAADGSRSVRVYAANGGIITLEPDVLRDPLNATVSELANAAGIFDEDRPGPPPKPVEFTDESVEAEPSETPKG